MENCSSILELIVMELDLKETEADLREMELEQVMVGR